MFTILVVDDEEMALGLCKYVLAGFSGFHILSATCGREALNVAGHCGTAVDVLLTDICMPGEMDGVGLAEKMEEVQPGVRIILMSGYSRDHFSFRSAWRFLPKPFSTRELVATVQEALGTPAVSRSWMP
jgi:two-component system, cell cycle sensor histidine kinase and response regulator CckA